MPRPHLSLNLAISADGKLSPHPSIAGAFTSSADHARFLQLRAKADALAVGRATWQADRMTLLIPGKPESPRFILARSNQIDWEHPIFSCPGGRIHWVCTTPEIMPPVDFPDCMSWHALSLTEWLEMLPSLGIQHLHCEGGGQLVHALAALDVIDEFHLTISGNRLFGGLNAPTPTGPPILGFLPKALNFQLSHFEVTAEGEALTTYLRRSQV